MAFSKIIAESMDLTDTYAFTGTVTGAGGGKVLASYHTQTTSGSSSDSAWSLQSGLTTNITPASSSSKFLLMVGIQTKINHGEGMGVRIDRDSTQILVNPTHVNDVYYTSGGSGEVNIWSIKNFIDSPSTSSAFDYKIYCYTTGTVQVPNTSINYLTILELSS